MNIDQIIMIMKYRVPLIFVGLLFLTLTSCQAVNDAEQVADEFHAKLDAHDHDFILDNLVDEEEIEVSGRDTWKNFLETVASWGKISNREQTNGFHIKTNNGLTTVKLEYTFENDYGLMYEALVLVSRGSGYKVLVVSMNTDKSEVDAYTKDFD